MNIDKASSSDKETHWYVMGWNLLDVQIADYMKHLLRKMSNAMQFPIPLTPNNRLTITILPVPVVFNFQFSIFNFVRVCV